MTDPEKIEKVDPNFSHIRWLNRIPGYHYYDSPEGEDCLQKVLYMNKLGILFGTFVSSIDVVIYTKPVGIGNVAIRYATITLPFMAVGSTFAAATCLSTNLRQKDDFWNYVNGGVAAGAVTGAIARSGTLGTFLAFSFGVMGAIKKHANDNGHTLFPPMHQKYRYQPGGLWSTKWDFSLTPDDLPKGWKSADK